MSGDMGTMGRVKIREKVRGKDPGVPGDGAEGRAVTGAMSIQQKVMGRKLGAPQIVRDTGMSLRKPWPMQAQEACTAMGAEKTSILEENTKMLTKRKKLETMQVKIEASKVIRPVALLTDPVPLTRDRRRQPQKISSRQPIKNIPKNR
ncbi:hypothetical protein TGRUB_360160, partial [Toxoplasma gondii RUB]